MTKKLFALSVICMIIFVQNSTVEASSFEEETSVGVSFIKEKEVLPTTIDQEAIKKIDKQSIKTPVYSGTTTSGKVLPKTNEIIGQGLKMLGASLLFITVLIHSFNRRRENYVQ
ncbi:hypothetical protein [Enterococcus sp. AZ072]|uniref:hypothetical protein n=1 Tax=unclassified Enterococcus TaxID=2608891 RepID=UPI003D2A52D2